LNKRSSPSTTRLTDAIVHDVDEQRRRLARAIHDGPSQTVSAAAMNLELVERDAAQLRPVAREALTTARQQLQEAVSELSRLSHEQEPLFLGQGGLLNAALMLARRSGQRLDVQLDATQSLPALGRVVELTAYRLLEACLDGLFAEPGPISARLGHDGAQLSLTLSGRPAAGPPASLRLLAFRQRAQLGGGHVAVSRAVKRGRREIRLVVRFPVARPTRQDRGAGPR
jgi:signal transduction histidine kinase